jgi:hypothetical protein
MACDSARVHIVDVERLQTGAASALEERREQVRLRLRELPSARTIGKEVGLASESEVTRPVPV